ncbi:MAG TPA: hypothetical protein VK065_01650 [Brevibacterium sp.]|nr:hypothetical protein [Brevibacterium sp.]
MRPDAMALIETLDVTDEDQMDDGRTLYEEALDQFFAPIAQRFLSEVIGDAAAALASGALVAAGGIEQKRDSTGRFVADPFSFTQVMERWYGAVRELADGTDLDESQIRMVMHGADLPRYAYDDVAETLQTAAAEEWTTYKTKRALSATLIPKESSGMWDSRSKYRTAVSRIARTLATENWNLQVAGILDTMGFEMKRWVSKHDARVRPTHSIAHGQTVRLADRFIVGAARLLYPGDPSAPIGEVANCRCTLTGARRTALREDITMTHPRDRKRRGTAAARIDQYATLATEAEDEAAEVVAEETEAEPEEEGPDLVMWHGVIGMEQTMTGDGRLIEDGALRWEDLPIPLRYVSQDTGGHQGAEVVGTIQFIEREEDGRITATGTFDTSSDIGQEAVRQVGGGLTRGVSMDLDDVSFEVRVAEDVLEAHEAMLDGDGEDGEARAVVEGKVVMMTMASDDEVHVTTSARIRAATIVSIPAFAEAQIDLVDDDDAVSDEEAIGQLGPEDEIGEDDVEETYNWVDDVGGLPKYIRRIADHLIAKGMSESRAIASAVNTVKRWARGGKVTAGPGGPNVSAKTAAKAAAAVAEWEAKKIRARASAAGTSALALVAAGGPVAPPSEWFEDPRLAEPTALTVTKRGQVYGHLAVWDSCHIAHPDSCVSPPRSATGYAYFHTGALLTADGEEVAVGHLTMNTGHASDDKRVMAALAHYDDTGTVGADVRVGEDQHGIWVAGALRSGLSDEQVRSLRSAPLSGDWRRVNGSLELVAALAVNVPGFPVPRPSGRRAAGNTVALVASGMVPPRKVRRPGTEGALSQDDLRYLKHLARRERQSQADAMARRIAEERVRSMAATL